MSPGKSGRQDKTERVHATEDSKKILSCCYRGKERTENRFVRLVVACTDAVQTHKRVVKGHTLAVPKYDTERHQTMHSSPNNQAYSAQNNALLLHTSSRCVIESKFQSNYPTICAMPSTHSPSLFAGSTPTTYRCCGPPPASEADPPPPPL